MSNLALVNYGINSKIEYMECTVYETEPSEPSRECQLEKTLSVVKILKVIIKIIIKNKYLIWVPLVPCHRV